MTTRTVPVLSRAPLAGALLSLFLATATVSIHAQDTLYWNRGSGTWELSATTWATTPGGEGTTAWSNGNSAVIENTNPSLALAVDISAQDFTAAGGASLVNVSAATATTWRTLTVTGNGSGNLDIRASIGRLTVNLGGTSAWDGLLVTRGGGSNRVAITSATGAGIATRVRLEGGLLGLDTALAGQVVTIGELSGSATGAEVTAAYGANNVATKTLRVEQSTTTTYAGKLAATNGGRELAFAKAGSGTLTLSGALLHSGGVTAEAGTLVITGTTSDQGNYTIDSGATLRAATTINFGTVASRALTVKSGGILAPGAIDTVGTLTLVGGDGTGAGLVFEGAATVLFRLGSAQDKIELTGAGMTGSAAGGAGSIVFRFTDNGGLVDGQAYDLISFAGTSPGIALESFTSNWGDTFQYNGNTLQFVYNAANIPEPASVALLLAGALTTGMLVIRRHGTRA
ncbi:PEP-CTERM putative exosortase interaction domain-containing protein [Opitutaceae bacterium TAV1]|nr:PEP-CTERM putative exosortase interaction domain-containing protein [Opitutaceae bacterium TAV1]